MAVADHVDALRRAMEIDGALGVALVDSGSGMALATTGSPTGLDLDVAAAGNSNVVRATLRTLSELNTDQTIDDILITLDKQYHLIRPLTHQDALFLYLVLDRAHANPAMARYRLAAIGEHLTL